MDLLTIKQKIKTASIKQWIPSHNMLVSQATGFKNQKKEIFQLAEKHFNMTSWRNIICWRQLR